MPTVTGETHARPRSRAQLLNTGSVIYVSSHASQLGILQRYSTNPGTQEIQIFASLACDHTIYELQDMAKNFSET